MASSTFYDPSPSDETEEAKKSVTIVIGENGEFSYDSKILQNIIGKIVRSTK